MCVRIAKARHERPASTLKHPDFGISHELLSVRNRPNLSYTFAFMCLIS